MREKTKVACGELLGECCIHFLPKNLPLCLTRIKSLITREKKQTNGGRVRVCHFIRKITEKCLSSLRDIRGMIGTDQAVRLKCSIDLMYRSRF